MTGQAQQNRHVQVNGEGNEQRRGLKTRRSWSCGFPTAAANYFQWCKEDLFKTNTFHAPSNVL